MIIKNNIWVASPKSTGNISCGVKKHMKNNVKKIKHLFVTQNSNCQIFIQYLSTAHLVKFNK